MSESETDSSLHSMIDDMLETTSDEYSSSENSDDSETGETIEHISSLVPYTDYDSETDEMIELIYFYEQDFLDSEKENKHYYIGNNKTSTDKQYILYANSVTPNTFFRFNINHIQSYLLEYSIFVTSPNIDIMQLFILDDYTYTVVIKTYWLRIIQRHWKKIYSQRKYCINRRKQIKTMMYVERNGRYPYDCDIMPGLHGMLMSYNKKLLIKCH